MILNFDVTRDSDEHRVFRPLNVPDNVGDCLIKLGYAAEPDETPPIPKQWVIRYTTSDREFNTLWFSEERMALDQFARTCERRDVVWAQLDQTDPQADYHR